MNSNSDAAFAQLATVIIVIAIVVFLVFAAVNIALMLLVLWALLQVVRMLKAYGEGKQYFNEVMAQIPLLKSGEEVDTVLDAYAGRKVESVAEDVDTRAWM